MNHRSTSVPACCARIPAGSTSLSGCVSVWARPPLLCWVIHLSWRWLTDWLAEITCMTTACTYTLHSTLFSSSATVHPYQYCRRAITQQTLPTPPPSPSLHSLNNPYSYSISDEWERERAKQLTPAPSATPRFDVWGDSIVIDPEEGGGYGTATLIRQRRA